MRMPNTTCSLKKARRLRGCCTWVQAGSGRAILAIADAHVGTSDVLYLSKCDPDQTDKFLNVPLTMAT